MNAHFPLDKGGARLDTERVNTFSGENMALTRNYDAMGMWSQAAIARAKRKKAKRSRAAQVHLDQIKRLMATGLNYSQAAAKRNRDLQAKEAEKRKRRKEIKRLKHTQKVIQDANHKAAKAGLPKPPLPKTIGRPVIRPHYRAGMGSTEFYSCWEWKTLRYEVLREFGPKCMLCGDFGNHIDHIKPRSKFPALELVRSNLQVLCEACNVGKSSIYTDDWRSKGTGTRSDPES